MQLGYIQNFITLRIINQQKKKKGYFFVEGELLFIRILLMLRT